MNKLDQMSEDIKAVEEYLANYPLTENFDLDINDSSYLQWNVGGRCILLYHSNEVKKLCMHCVASRLIGYAYLPKFIKHCLELQNKIFDGISAKKTHEEIMNLIGKQ